MGAQPNFNLLDGAALGTNLEIQESGLVVTCKRSAVNAAGAGDSALMKVRGMQPKTSGVWMYEFAYYGNDPAAGLVSLGICTALSTLNTGVGIDASSYGYRPADGGIWQGNAQLAACATSPAKTYIQVVADFTNSTLTIYGNGATLASIAISPATGGRIYYPAFTIGSVNAYGLSGFVNFGQRKFQYPIPGALGWYTMPSAPTPVYACNAGDEGVSSWTSDTPASTNYAPDWLNFDDWYYEKKCAVWIHREQQQNSFSYGSIDLDASGGKYTDLVFNTDYRDATVVVRQLTPPGSALATAYTLCTALVDRCEYIDESIVRVYLKGKLTALQRPLQKDIFPPFADKGVAGRPVPILIGAARSADVGTYLTDQEARNYQAADGAISNVAAVRHGGNRLDPNATPPGYTLSNDLRSIIPQQLATMKLTADLSACGTQTVYPGAPDVLNGNGSNWDTTWTTNSAAPPTFTAVNTDPGGYSSLSQRITNQGPHKLLQLASARPMTAIGGSAFYVRTTGTPLRAGKTYIIRFVIWDYSAGGDRTTSGLAVMSAQTSYLNSQQWISPFGKPLIGAFHSDVPVSLVYRVPPGADRSLYFTVFSGSGQVCSVLLRNVIIEELADTVPDLPLVGVGFRDWMNTVLTTHGGLDPSEWSAGDCDALDAAYPGAPLGTQLTDAITVDGAMRLPLDSVCGDATEDRFGVIRFKRLVDPRLATPLATYDESRVDFPVGTATPDYANKLTQSFGYQRNVVVHQDSDFVTDTVAVPPSFRTQLKQDCRGIKTSNVQLRGMYSFAALATYLRTYFDIEATAAAELERINRIFAVDRVGYSPPVFMPIVISYDGTPPDFLFGDVIAINYNSQRTPQFRWSFVGNVAIYTTRLIAAQKRIAALVWG